MFGTSFGDETEESPSAVVNAKAFRAKALTSTVRRRGGLIASSQTAFPTIFRPANIARDGGRFTYSRKGIFIVKKTLPDTTPRDFEFLF
jgi:hypothetical protein